MHGKSFDAFCALASYEDDTNSHSSVVPLRVHCNQCSISFQELMGSAENI